MKKTETLLCSRLPKFTSLIVAEGPEIELMLPASRVWQVVGISDPVVQKTSTFILFVGMREFTGRPSTLVRSESPVEPLHQEHFCHILRHWLCPRLHEGRQKSLRFPTTNTHLLPALLTPREETLRIVTQWPHKVCSDAVWLWSSSAFYPFQSLSLCLVFSSVLRECEGIGVNHLISQINWMINL